MPGVSALVPAVGVMHLPSGETLTGPRLLFVKEYPRDFNAARAARAAGVGPKSCHRRGREWLLDPLVQEALVLEVHDRFEAAHVSVERVLQEMYDCAMANVRDFFDGEGRPIPIQHLPRRKVAAVQEYRLEREETTTPEGYRVVKHNAVLKLNGKANALAGLGKYLGMFSGEEKDGGLMPVEFVIEEIPE